MEIAFLHTAELHVQTFDRLLDQLGFHGRRTHKVMPELLRRARSQGLESVREDVFDAFAEMVSANAVMCTCSTIGPYADELARTQPHVLRIDRPAMEEACTYGPDVLLAVCLESTLSPSLDLLRRCANDVHVEISPRVVLCEAAWPHFEAGDVEAFAKAIAERISDEAAQKAPHCIVLGQASMCLAESHLGGLDVPVISSPSRAAAKAVEVARNRPINLR